MYDELDLRLGYSSDVRRDDAKAEAEAEAVSFPSVFFALPPSIFREVSGYTVTGQHTPPRLRWLSSHASVAVVEWAYIPEQTIQKNE